MAQVLIVDDERGVRDLIKRWIRVTGHEIREAGHAQAALASMAELPSDVVFCDVQMPGEDGLWLTGQLRNKYPSTAVILATGVSSVPPNVSMQAGVVAYVVKPFNRIALLDALDMALQFVNDAKAHGPRAEDRGQPLQDWLDQLKEL